MARVVKCPICEKVKKIKHNHYVNFTCCYKKFPILEHDVIRKQYGKEKVEEKAELKELRALKVVYPVEKARKTTITEEEADASYKWKCEKCGAWFDEFEDGCCPNKKCGVRLKSD
ncbi:hypothetical protein KAT36_00335 [Candidatus Pacearchaeota archaeon]|nr:hypothetical protein [Candidatus Pacearchaeota archaeon]